MIRISPPEQEEVTEVAPLEEEDDSDRRVRAADNEPAPRSSRSVVKSRVERRPSKSAYAADRYDDGVEDKPGRPLRDYAYCFLLFALLPLIYTLILGERDSIEDRLKRTLQNLPEEQRGIIEQASGSEDAIFKLFPGGRIVGAHLPRKTLIHYLYALLSALAFFGLSLLLAPSYGGRPIRVLLVGLFTGTIGIAFLFIVQLLAALTQARVIFSRNPVILVIYWVAFAIGFSYNIAEDPEMNFVASFFGFTFGVGLCEEVCKAIPLIAYYKNTRRPDWRVACSWGFASGVGFGVAEGVMYAGRHYNGIAMGDVYLTRFISCVALHAIWSVSVALFMHSHRRMLQGPFHWVEYIPRVIFIVSVPMVLHGMYDTALKKELNWLALVVALASFGWLAWCIERARSKAIEADTRRVRSGARAWS
jgi:RsiW-degrading membrane proteinase PrsW (M82 family)